MQIEPIQPNNPRQTGEFLHLPFHLYRDIPQWVPPLHLEAGQILDRHKHPFYRHSDAAFFLARDASGQVVGRIAVADNRRYNDYNHEQTAFFWLFECANDPEAAAGLFDAAETWAKGRGLNKIYGPKGFTVLDGMGLLVKGFEHRPAFGIPYHPAYYANLIEANGFEPSADIVSGYLPGNANFPEKIHRASELIQKRRGLRIEHYRTRRDLRALVPKLKALYNDAIRGTIGTYPITDEEANGLANQLLWFADPRLIKIIWKGDEPVGFLFAYPDVSAALQRTRGRIFPFGWIELLREMRQTQWVNINGAGVVEEIRGQGGTAILFSEMQKSLAAFHFRHAEIVQIGADNDKMLRELRDLGIDFYKTHRVYTKALITQSRNH
jgi:hypothetical protein